MFKNKKYILINVIKNLIKQEKLTCFYKKKHLNHFVVSLNFLNTKIPKSKLIDRFGEKVRNISCCFYFFFF